MINYKKVIILSLILFVGLTVVSAADIIDDDAIDTTIETPQIEQTNTGPVVPSVQEEDEEEEHESNDVEISSDVTITSSNVGQYTDNSNTPSQNEVIFFLPYEKC